MATAAPALTWDQVAGLQPRLPAGVGMHRHSYRGVPWYVVQDGASARHLRLSEGAWRIAGLMDGQRSLAQIHAALAAELGSEAPDQDSILQVFADLRKVELVECPELANAALAAERQRRHRQLPLKRLLATPFSQRIPLFDPQTTLDRWLPSVSHLISPVGFLIWLLVVLLGISSAFVHWPEISAGMTSAVLSPNNLVLLVLAFLLLKVLHELGHGFVARSFGGEVHEIGIMLLVFMPVPYIDASSSSAFPDKHQRMAVAAAGIMVELFLTVLALTLWLSVEPGVIRDLAFNVMLVGGFSTVLGNGNPLLRFDGYYVLCDALEIPNLGARSTRYLGYLVQRYICGAEAAESPVAAPGERGWFVSYGIAAAIYRVAILITIILFVAEAYPVIGVVLGAWAVTSQLLLPSVRGIKGLLGAPALADRRRHATLVLGVPAAVAALAAITVPLPAWTTAEGVVWLPEQAHVRAGADGILDRQLVADGQQVAAGTPVFIIDADNIRAEVAVLEHRLEEHQALVDAALFHDRARVVGLELQLERIRAELASSRQQAAALQVQSPLAGTLLVPEAHRLAGRYLHKGDVLGYVDDAGPGTTKVAIRQDEIDRVREDTHSVRVSLPGYPEHNVVGHISSATPRAAQQLPSAALGVLGGGRIAVDGQDLSGKTPADSIFVLDVALTGDRPQVPLGTRVLVRFEHSRLPLAGQITRAARQLLLARFGV